MVTEGHAAAPDGQQHWDIQQPREDSASHGAELSGQHYHHNQGNQHQVFIPTILLPGRFNLIAQTCVLVMYFYLMSLLILNYKTSLKYLIQFQIL